MSSGQGLDAPEPARINSGLDRHDDGKHAPARDRATGTARRAALTKSRGRSR
jgi:hypothetical protein